MLSVKKNKKLPFSFCKKKKILLNINYPKFNKNDSKPLFLMTIL